MAPILHCVRHAQGFHNLGVEFHGLPDPRLTPHGESQCAALSKAVGPEFQSRISLIAASPLTRTIHTAYLSFEPALTKSDKCAKQIFAVPDAQEISDFPCDTGSDPSVLKARCRQNGWDVDLSLVTDGWNVKTGRYAASSQKIAERARDARRLLRAKIEQLTQSVGEDVEIVLVSHGGYLHYFTGDWEGATSRLGTGWENCELRSYNFAAHVPEKTTQAEEVDEAWLIETPASRTKRGLQGPMKGTAEQEELFEDAMAGWEAQGLTTPLPGQTAAHAPIEGEGRGEDGMEEIARTLTRERRESVSVSVAA